MSSSIVKYNNRMVSFNNRIVKYTPPPPAYVMKFDGVDDKVTFTGNLFDLSGNTEISFNLYLFESPNGETDLRLMEFGDGTYNSLLVTFGVNKWHVMAKPNALSGIWAINRDDIPTGQTHLIQIFKTGDIITDFKVNGVTKTTSPSLLNASISQYEIGAHPGELSLWNLQIKDSDTQTVLHNIPGDGNLASNWEDTVAVTVTPSIFGSPEKILLSSLS